MPTLLTSPPVKRKYFNKFLAFWACFCLVPVQPAAFPFLLTGRWKIGLVSSPADLNWLFMNLVWKSFGGGEFSESSSKRKGQCNFADKKGNWWCTCAFSLFQAKLWLLPLTESYLVSLNFRIRQEEMRTQFWESKLVYNWASLCVLRQEVSCKLHCPWNKDNRCWLCSWGRERSVQKLLHLPDVSCFINLSSWPASQPFAVENKSSYHNYVLKNFYLKWIIS